MLVVLIGLLGLMTGFQAELSGRVLDPDGRPVAQARITVLDGQTLDTLATRVWTDAEGRYQVTVAISRAELEGGAHWAGSIYPNPVQATTRRLVFPFVRNEAGNPAVEVFTGTGQRVEAAEYMAPGVYFARLRWMDGVTSSARGFHMLEGGSMTIVPRRLAPGELPADARDDFSLTTDVLVIAEHESYASYEQSVVLRDAEPTYHDVRLALADTERFQDRVISPDGRLEVVVKLQDEGSKRGCLTYRASIAGRPIVLDSPLRLYVEGASELGCGLESVYIQREEVDAAWQPIYGERDLVPNHYRTMTLMLREREAPGRSYKLIVRAYDEGFAFRYGVETSIVLTEEQSAFQIPVGTEAYVDFWYEDTYERMGIPAIGSAAERPMTLVYPGGYYATLTEAATVDYARMRLGPGPTRDHTLYTELDGPVRLDAGDLTPWRVFIVGDRPGDLLEQNYLIQNLNPPNRLSDTSWIRPGTGVNTMNLGTEPSKQYIDLAARYGIDYLLLDTGWYGDEYDPASDATTTIDRLDLPDLVAYADRHGVGIMLYVNRLALEQQLDELLPLYASWGVQGVKFGFIKAGTQEEIRWLHEAIRKAAEHRLVLDIHDAYRPVGFSRTYPHLLTQEGIHGNEHMPSATHNTTLPFTRFVAGAADYTIAYFDERVQASYAHQLALGVVYYSPLQMLFWYDIPYMFEPERPELAFFDDIPTTWDETRVLDGAIGEYAVVARREGSTWYLGAITNEEARTLRVPLDFLEPGVVYRAERYADAPSGAVRAPAVVTEETAEAGATLTLELAPSGGQALRLSPLSP